MKRYGLTAAVLCLCVGAAGAADKNNQVLLLGGFAVPTTRVDFGGVGGSKETIGSAGGFVAGQFFHAVHPRVSLGGEINYIGNGSSDVNSIPTFASSTRMDSVSFLALLKGYFNDPAPWRFYGSGGFGAQNTVFNSDVHPKAGFVWADTGTTETRHLRSSSVTSFAMALGFGFEALVSDSFFLGGEGRFQFAAADHYAIANTIVDRLSVHNLIFAAKAGLRF